MGRGGHLHFSQLDKDFKRCHLAIYVYISNMLFGNTAFWHRQEIAKRQAILKR
jgi:hypothetical protein